jgi:hypothetical protein
MTAPHSGVSFSRVSQTPLQMANASINPESATISANRVGFFMYPPKNSLSTDGDAIENTLVAVGVSDLCPDTLFFESVRSAEKDLRASYRTLDLALKQQEALSVALADWNHYGMDLVYNSLIAVFAVGRRCCVCVKKCCNLYREAENFNFHRLKLI